MNCVVGFSGVVVFVGVNDCGVYCFFCFMIILIWFRIDWLLYLMLIVRVVVFLLILCIVVVILIVVFFLVFGIWIGWVKCVCCEIICLGLLI